MDTSREWHWQDATGRSTPAEAKRILLEQAEQLRQKDEAIKALADVLEAHNNRATRRLYALSDVHEIILSEEEHEKMRSALAKAGRIP